MRSLHSLPSRSIKATRSKAISPQQASFELRNRVFLALNKLADRDTHQIGVEELDKIINNLGPESIVSVLSCISETDSEQKSAVRKECVKLMGTMTKLHGALMAPYLGKMIASIAKRLRDPDTVVRDVCGETVGLLAYHLGCFSYGDNGGAVAVLSKPLFEALGEQNRNVQMGAAMSLTRVFDEAREVPISLLQQMLTRIIKLLKNPHFMAKPALVDLIRSIVQAGGASSAQTLSLAVNSIQEGLKSSEWTTRKAAAVALQQIAENADLLSRALWPFKATSIQSLERARFDKVKPVRDAAMQALNYWKSISEFDSGGVSSTPSPPKVQNLHEESEGSCVTKSFESKSNRATPEQYKNQVYDDSADNLEFSATSDPLQMSVETKKVIVMPDSFPSSCSSELAGIRKQLEDIKRAQSSLMVLLQGFAQNSMDTLSELKLKVNDLEITVDKIAQNSSSRNSIGGLQAKPSPSSCLSTSRPMAKTTCRTLKNLSPSLLAAKNADDKLFGFLPTMLDQKRRNEQIKT
ncbi:ARM repeat superfamily protein [Wolffia australiana]